jgi:hypothetical protein
LDAIIAMFENFIKYREENDIDNILENYDMVKHE